MVAFHDLTASQRKEATQLGKQIEKLQAKLAALLGGTAPKAPPGGPVAKRTKNATKRGKASAVPAWHLAHVRSPLDTLMAPAPKKKGGLRAGGKAKASSTKNPGPAAKKKDASAH